VWTSAGVIVGVGTVALTGWGWLDPAVALAVAANIVWSGVHLLRRALLGLLDTALPAAERARLTAIFEHYAREQGVQFHALRTREAGARRFISFHVLVPGQWTVQRGHALLERIERDAREALPGVTVFTHLESLDDPTSWDDTTLDRLEEPAARP
jgi:cation diffusion facilitator family transporter